VQRGFLIDSTVPRETLIVANLFPSFPDPEFKNWWWCVRLVEQVQAINCQQSTETLDLAFLLNQTGYFLHKRGRYGEAEPIYRQALKIRRSQLGDIHLDTATSLNNLAGLYRAQGGYREAEPLYRQALAITRSQLGDTHPDTATSLNNLAALYYSQGRYSDAEPLYLQAIAIRMEKLGENHPNTQTGWENFVYFLQQAVEAGRAAELSDDPTTQAVLAQLQAES